MKIDSLPIPILRELVLRFIDERDSAQIVRWLNALPEVKAILAIQFAGSPISEEELDEWRHGDGIRAVASGQPAYEIRVEQAPAPTFAIPGLSALLQQVVENYARFSARWQADPEDPRFEAELRVLKSLSAGVLALCRLENQTARLQLARERFELQREKHEAKADALRFEALREVRGAVGTNAQGATGANAAAAVSASKAVPPRSAPPSTAPRSPLPAASGRSGDASLTAAASPGSSSQTFLAGSIAERLSPPAPLNLASGITGE